MMALSNIQQGRGVYSPSFAHPLPRRSAQLSFAPARQSDTVHFSEKAMELAQKNQEAMDPGKPNADMGISEKDLPIEAFSLPDWYADLMSDYSRVDDQLGIPYADSRRARYDSLSSTGKKNLSEYNNTLTKYFQEALENAGIRGPVDYYTSIVQNKERSEEVHQAVKQRLGNDSRAMELMRYFGISL